MAKTAIALIVAGTGETTEQEVFDLLEDAYPLEGYEEVGVIAPIDKDLFSKSVQNVLAWYQSDKDVYAIQTEGSSLSRASSAIGSGARKVANFTEVLAAAEYEDWDEAVFLVAMPEDPEDTEYDRYAEMVEVAIENGLTVKNLCRGLDDVTLEDAPEAEAAAEPEPEPEPEEKPKRKSRARKPKEEAPEPEPESQGEDVTPDGPPWEEPEKDLQEEVNEAAARVEEAPLDPRFHYHAPDEISIALHTEMRAAFQEIARDIEALGEPSRERSLAVTKIEEAMFWTNAHIARNITTAEPSKDAEEAPEQPETPSTPSGRGRGRPRTNFEVKQIWDEDEGEWIPRPKGRMRKGTEWRTIHADTNEVLDEGTA